jgi:hypothetical protein
LDLAFSVKNIKRSVLNACTLAGRIGFTIDIGLLSF